MIHYLAQRTCMAMNSQAMPLRGRTRVSSWLRDRRTARALPAEKPNDGVGVDRLVCGLRLSLPFGLLDQRFPKNGALTHAVFDERILHDAARLLFAQSFRICANPTLVFVCLIDIDRCP
jgi:hypothetical protein